VATSQHFQTISYFLHNFGRHAAATISAERWIIKGPGKRLGGAARTAGEFKAMECL
jgi:hypothetical protein